MEKEKRITQINVKVTPTTYKLIQEIAEKQHWTVSTTANIILEQFCRDQKEIRL